MKVEYTELIVLKSGVTMFLQKTLNVTRWRVTCVYVENNENDGFWLAKKRINSGPEKAVVTLSVGKVPIDRVDECLAEVKEIKE